MSNIEQARSDHIKRLALLVVDSGRPHQIVDSVILAVISSTPTQCTLQELRRELRHLAKLGVVRIEPSGASPAGVQVTLTRSGVDTACLRRALRERSAANKADLAALLQQHVGLDLAITSTAIAGALGCDEHRVRSLVAELHEDGIAVCEHPERGYFIAATSDELGEACTTLRSRAMQTLAVEAKLSHVPLSRLIDLLWLKEARA